MIRFDTFFILYNVRHFESTDFKAVVNPILGAAKAVACKVVRDQTVAQLLRRRVWNASGGVTGNRPRRASGLLGAPKYSVCAESNSIG